MGAVPVSVIETLAVKPPGQLLELAYVTWQGPDPPLDGEADGLALCDGELDGDAEGELLGDADGLALCDGEVDGVGE
jgi:hypothetical protein